MIRTTAELLVAAAAAAASSCWFVGVAAAAAASCLPLLGVARASSRRGKCKGSGLGRGDDEVGGAAEGLFDSVGVASRGHLEGLEGGG